ARRVDVEHLPEDPDRHVAAVGVGPPLVAVAAFGRARAVLAADRALHPRFGDHLLAVDAAAIEHELPEARVVAEGCRQAAAAGVAAVALVAEPGGLGGHAVRLPDHVGQVVRQPAAG